MISKNVIVELREEGKNCTWLKDTYGLRLGVKMKAILNPKTTYGYDEGTILAVEVSPGYFTNFWASDFVIYGNKLDPRLG